jgi:cysteine-rich repeat protein
LPPEEGEDEEGELPDQTRPRRQGVVVDAQVTGGATEPAWLRIPAPPTPSSNDDFTFLRQTDLPIVSSNSRNEPSVANSGKVIILTNNWDASISTDFAKTFKRISRYFFPVPPTMGQCCDVGVDYNQRSDALFWVQQHCSKNGGMQRIVVDKAGDGTADCGYDINAQTLGFPGVQYYLDFPDLTFSDNYVYLTVDAFYQDPATSCGGIGLAGSVVARFALTEMANCSDVHYDSYIDRTHTEPRATQGAHTTMYWASTTGSTTFRIYRWADDPAAPIYFDDRRISGTYSPDTTCMGPDGNSFCGHADDRILGAYVAKGVIGFMWNAGSPTNRTPYNYVQMVRFNESDRGLVDERQIYSINGAYMYPSVSVNARGDIGGTMVFGGGGGTMVGAFHPSCVAWIADGKSNGQVETYLAQKGAAGPADNQWGDYLTTRAFNNTWMGTCFAFANKADTRPKPRFVWFGRQRDNTVPQGDEPFPTFTARATATETPPGSPRPPTSTHPPTATPTPPPTRKPTATAIPSPTLTTLRLCSGDCDGDTSVTVAELLKGVNIALGIAAVDICPALDTDGDGEVTIAELTAAINRALNGCPTPTPTPRPDEIRCGNGIIDGPERCDDGNTFGGDGCAANCTTEQTINFPLDPAGTQLLIQFASSPFTVNLSGSLPLVAGAPRTVAVLDSDGAVLFAPGDIPVIARAEEATFDAVRVPSLGCLCVHALAAPQFGPGNSAAGKFACGTSGLTNVNYVFELDHNTNDIDPQCANGTPDLVHPGVCNGLPSHPLIGIGPAGSAVLTTRLAISIIVDGGTCAVDPTNPDKGPDGIPCTDDDPIPGIVEDIPLTTGTAGAIVRSANNIRGRTIVGPRIGGRPFDCNSIARGQPNLSVGTLVGAFAALDVPNIGDVAGAGTFTAECPGTCPCGGTSRTQCPYGRFCELPAGACTVAHSSGVCEPVPLDCQAYFEPVCGCDGTTYDNDCERMRAAAAKDYAGPCEGITQSAYRFQSLARRPSQRSVPMGQPPRPSSPHKRRRAQRSGAAGGSD